MMNHSEYRDNLVKTITICVVLWFCVFGLYEITFVRVPNLFSAMAIGQRDLGDFAEYAEAERGKPDLGADAKKHLLHFPVTRTLYLIARIFTPEASDDSYAIVFPNAVCGATAVVLCYLLFTILLSNRQEALIASLVYTVSWCTWFYSSVPESYALTMVAANLFFIYSFQSMMHLTTRWALGLGALVAFCGLCDLRYSSLFIVVCIRFLQMDAPLIKRIGFSVVSVIWTMLLVGVAYQAVDEIFGLENFGVRAMLRWLRDYGSGYASVQHAFDIHSNLRVITDFFVFSIAPLYPDFFGSVGRVTEVLHVTIWCMFAVILAIVLGASICEIVNIVRGDKRWLSVLAWLFAITAFHLFYAPGSGVHFATPVVLPYLAYVILGVKQVLKRKNDWSWLLIVGTFFVLIFMNNLLLILGIHHVMQGN